MMVFVQAEHGAYYELRSALQVRVNSVEDNRYYVMMATWIMATGTKQECERWMENLVDEIEMIDGDRTRPVFIRFDSWRTPTV